MKEHIQKKALQFSLLVSLLALGFLAMAYNKAEQENQRVTKKQSFPKTFSLPKKSFKERMKELEPFVLPQIKKELGIIREHNKKIALVIYKKERLLQLWTNDQNKKLIKEYAMTAFSGKLGPKNRQGDLQIPEGLYRATFLHPNSQYHLSIKVSYPNDNDKKRAQKNKIKDPGGDIFIHGSNVTIGCVPIGDHAIEELFYLVGKAGLLNTKILIAPQKLPFPELSTFLGKTTQDSLIQAKYKNLQKALADFQ